MKRRRSPTELTLAGLDAVMAVNAFGGAWYGVTGAPNVPREWLEGTPFKTYTVPAVILGVAVGGSHAAAVAALLGRSERAPQVASAASVIAMAWIGVQVAMIGYVSPLQPIVFGAGAVSGALARRLAR